MFDLDTINGLFGDAVTVAARRPPEIAAAVERFEREGGAIDPAVCRAHALEFAPERFRSAYLAEVAAAWARHGGRVAD